jgi:hypothetical protein
MSATPILDRELTLPPPAIPSRRAQVLVVFGIFVIAAVLSGAILGSRAAMPSARESLSAMFPELFAKDLNPAMLARLALIALATVVATVAVHEIGHMIAGLLAGFRFDSLRVGPFTVHRGCRFSFERSLGNWFGGAATVVPVSTDRLLTGAMVLVCGGPAASIVSGCAVLLFPAKSLAGWAFGIASLLGGLGDLVPFRFRSVVSDGARIRMLLWDRPQGERWLALLRLGAELASGTPPDLLPQVYLEKAIAFRDASPDTVTAHAIAYSTAFYTHKDDEAGRLLETCLHYSGFVAPAMRETLMSNAAVFQGRRRQREDLAQQWLHAIPMNTSSNWLRTRAEVAILEARGDLAASLSKLEGYDREVRALPQGAAREALMRGIQQWRSELTAADGSTA